MDTQTTKRAAPRLFFIITVVLAAIATICQTIIFYKNYDETTNLYNKDAFFPGIFYTAVFITVLFCAASYFIIKDNPMTRILPSADRFTIFAALLSGLQLGASVLFNGYYYMSEIYTGMTTLRAAVLITAVPAAVYFLLTALSRKQKRIPVILCGFCLIIWAALYLMCIYFDMTSPLNSPIRILNQLTLITVMLYFIFEIRYLLGIPKPRLYMPSALLAILFISISSISDLFLTFTRFRSTGPDTVFRIAEIAVMLYIAARLRSVVMNKSAAPDKSR